jgi:hypothetical protein
MTMEDEVNQELPHDIIEVPLPEPEVADATPDPVPVSLAELAQISAAQQPLAEAHAARVAALRKPGRKTPAGLPKGYQWVAHDTGKLGRAAARRRAQLQRISDAPAESELVCQRCGLAEGQVLAFLDGAKTVAHRSLVECVRVLRARVEELERLTDDIQDEVAEGADD